VERIKSLLEPLDCMLLLVEMQAALGFAVESSSRQTFRASGIVKSNAGYGMGLVYAKEMLHPEQVHK
jgi:hypothetical protein